MRCLRSLLALLLLAVAVAVPARAQGTRIKDLPLTTTIPIDGRIALDASTFPALRGVSISQLVTNLGALAVYSKLEATNGVAVGLTTATVPTTGNSVVNKTALDAAVAAGATTNAPIQTATIASLIAYTQSAVLASGQQFQVGGYYTNGDGGGGTFVWDSASTAITNRGTAFKMAASATGRVIRVTEDTLDPRWFGARGDAKASFRTVYTLGTDDSVAMQETVLWATIYGYKVALPGLVFRVETPLEIIRRDAAFTRLGISNTDTNDANPSTGWVADPRIILQGTGSQSKIVSTTITNGATLWVHGTTNSNGGAYGNRVDNVDVRDLHVMNTATSGMGLAMDVYNAGFIHIDRVEMSGDCYGGIRLRALSELYLTRSHVHNTSFGFITEQSPLSYEQGDISVVNVTDCVFGNCARASTLLNYYREIRFSRCEFVGREYTSIAALWAPGIGPIPNGKLFITQCHFESANGAVDSSSYTTAGVLLGASGNEQHGSYTNSVYPWTTSLANNQSAVQVLIADSVFGWGTGNNIRIKQQQFTSPIVIRGNTFFPTAADYLVIDSSFTAGNKVQLDSDNVPNLLAGMVDNRTTFNTDIQLRGFPALLSIDGFDNPAKLTNSMTGYTPVIAWNTNAFGRTNTVSLNSAASEYVLIPLGNESARTFQFGQKLYVDFVVKWTNQFAGDSLALFTTTNVVSLYNRGSLGNIQTITNVGGVWSRYVAVLEAQAGDAFTHLIFRNSAQPNPAPVLSHLAYAISGGGGVRQATPTQAFPTDGFTVGSGGQVRGGSGGIGIGKYPASNMALDVGGITQISSSFPQQWWRDSGQSATNGGLMRIIGYGGGFHYDFNTAAAGDFSTLYPVMQMLQGGAVSPGADNTVSLGHSGYYWSSVNAYTYNSYAANGTAPFAVISSNVVANLNASYINGVSASGFQPANQYLTNLSASGTIGSGTFVRSVAPTLSGTVTFTGSPKTSANFATEIWNDTNQSNTNGGLMRLIGYGGGYHLAFNTAVAGDFSTSVPLVQFLKGNAFSPDVDNAVSLGHSGYYWSSVNSYTYNSYVPTGTAPLTVASTTKVTNLNADLFDSLDSTAFQPANLYLTNLSAAGTTGSGAFVRATSPTLVTPALGAATSTSITTGANGITVTRLRHGRASAMVAGVIAVADAYVTANTRIILTVYTPGGTRGFLDTGTRTASTSFTITSSSVLDTSVVDWVAFEP